jgi:hypothetical protein
MTDNPLPANCAYLALAIPLVLAAGAVLARYAISDRSLRRVVAPGLAVAIWLVAVAAVARSRQAFVPGLVYGTFATAAIGAAAFALPGVWQGDHPIRLRSLLRGHRLAIFVIAVAVLIYPATRYFFSDEVGPVGHLGDVSQLQNGHYPPRFSIFPQFEFRYHYGFDVFAAMLSGLFRTSAAGAIDLATVLLWSYTAFLAAHLGRRFTASKHGILPAALILFAGGLPFHCSPGLSFSEQVTDNCTVEGFSLNQTVSAYFFQHPFGLGIPLTLTILLVLSDRKEVRAGRYLALGILSIALSLAHFPLFLAVTASLLVSEGFVGRRFVPRRFVFIVATLMVVAISARRLGGFLAPGPSRLSGLLDLHLGILDTLRGTITWHARSYGSLLPLGLLGLFFLRRERLMLTLLAVGSLAVPNLVRYRLSWDIVKFATIAELILGLAASALIVSVLAMPLTGMLERLGVRSAALALAFSCVAAGVAFHAVFWFDLRPIRRSLLSKPREATASEVAARTYLRAHAGPTELVYTRKGSAPAYYQVGLNTPWLLQQESFGFGPELTEPRRKLLRKLPDDLASYTREGIRWFVIEKSDRRFRKRVSQWLRRKLADKALELDDGLVIVRARRFPRR